MENGGGGAGLLLNGGDAVKEAMLMNGNGESHVNGNGYGQEEGAGEEGGVVGAEGQKMVIDLTAD